MKINLTLNRANTSVSLMGSNIYFSAKQRNAVPAIPMVAQSARPTKSGSVPSIPLSSDSLNVQKQSIRDIWHQYNQVTVAAVTDTHLNTDTHPQYLQNANTPRRPAVIEDLTRLNVSQKTNPNSLTLLSLCGDFIDFTASFPTDFDILNLKDREKWFPIVRETLKRIKANNPEVFALLNKFLGHKNTRLIYPWGNHDRWMADPEIQDLFCKAIGKNALVKGKITFPNQGYWFSPSLRVLTDHGHRHDDACAPPPNINTITVGDLMELGIFKPVCQNVLKRLENEHYSEEEIDKVREIFRKSFEKVRPPGLAFTYCFGKLKELNKEIRINHYGQPSLRKIALQETVKVIAVQYKNHPALMAEKSGFLLNFIQRYTNHRIQVSFLNSPFGRKALDWANNADSEKKLVSKIQRHLEKLGEPVDILITGHTHDLMNKYVNYKLKNGTIHTCLVMNPGSSKETILYDGTLHIPDPILNGGMIICTLDKVPNSKWLIQPPRTTHQLKTPSFVQSAPP